MGRHAPPSDPADLARRAFPTGTPFALEATEPPLAGLRRLVALRRHLGARPIPRLGAAAQHGPEDAARSLRDARKRAPDLRDAIDRAEEDYAFVLPSRGA